MICYVAYQGDVSDFQAMQVVETPPELGSDADRELILKTFRAMLLGWWTNKENAEMLRENEFEIGPGPVCCVPHGTVVRIAKDGWRAFDVDYTDVDLTEAMITETDIGKDEEEPLTGWPDFISCIVREQMDLQNAMAVLETELADMTDESRLKVLGVLFEPYCLHCGSMKRGKRCHCQNDPNRYATPSARAQ